MLKAKAKDSKFALEDISRPRTKAKDNNTAYITIAAFINHTPLLCLQFKIHLITAVNQSKHKVSIAITSDVVFPEKYYVENFLEIFHSGKISAAMTTTLWSKCMFHEKCKFYVFKSTFYSIWFVSNFKSNTTVTSNTDRSGTVTLTLLSTVCQ